FIDESAFDINIGASYGRSAYSTPTVTTIPLTKAKSHSILGAVSTVIIVNVDVSCPK
ncbi:hypothetical protein BDF14DRAFT_1728792, partial [Spinellus fusiger]